jgi:hypothetical protein
MKNLKHVFYGSVIVALMFNLQAVEAMGKKPPKDELPTDATESPATSSTAKPASVPIGIIYRNHQCNLMQAQARWVEEQPAYDALFKDLLKSYIRSQTEKPPAVDFTQYGVLLVAMGQKNTGGYAVDLASGDAKVGNGVLQVSVHWQEPRRGMMVTQALTSPCLLLKIPKAQFQIIEVNDQSGAVRLSGTINPEP